MNDDEKAKTGDDSLTSTSSTASYENDESTNTEIDKGLVVIKSSRPTYNQITYSASQKDYVVGSDSEVTNGTKVYLSSVDNPVTFKCLTNDAHSTVEWTTVQTYESVAQTTTSEKTYTDTADSTKKSTIKTTTVTRDNNGKQSADAATITQTNYGFDMSNAGYKFSVILNNATGVDNVDNLWYGKYGKEDDCMWDNSKEAMKTSGVDTAVSYSWNLGSETSYTKTIRMSLIAN